MKIGQVSKKYGLSKDNLYYYINYGLLVPPRLGSQYIFDEDTLADLEWILELKGLDFTLAEIHRILSLKRISNLENPKDRADLQEMYAAKRAECAGKIKHYEDNVRQLDDMILQLSTAENAAHRHTGLPLRMLDLLCCPSCGGTLSISDVNMDMKYIYDSKLTCPCGYCASVEDGILLTPNKNQNKEDEPDVDRLLYKDLPPALISLFQRSYNWMKDKLSQMDLSGKVIMETYINAWFFLHNHQQYFPTDGKYIIVDKYPETLRMYKELIEREHYQLDILYIADSSTNLPIVKHCVDLNLDFFAVNEHNFYHETFLLDQLTPYFTETAQLLGTYFYFDGGRRSMKNLLSAYSECSPNNFSLPYFLEQAAASGIRLSDSEDCGFTTDSGNNLGFSFHQTGEKMHLMSYLATR